MIASYNDRVAKFYNTTYSEARFYIPRIKIIFLHLKNTLAYNIADVVVVSSKVVGLTPGFINTGPDLCFRTGF
jgi:hypothetical protein